MGTGDGRLAGSGVLSTTSAENLQGMKLVPLARLYATTSAQIATYEAELENPQPYIDIELGPQGYEPDETRDKAKADLAVKIKTGQELLKEIEAEFQRREQTGNEAG